MTAAAPPVVLAIAGSDSGGGAGVQADIATLTSLGVHAATAVTAVTAQDSLAVYRSYAMPPDLVADQIRVVLADLPVSAVKTGMLPNIEIVQCVLDFARDGHLPNLVIDPVGSSSSGHELMDSAAWDLMRDHLLAYATVITPNAHEAALLLERPSIRSLTDAKRAAIALLDKGPRAVVITGIIDGPNRADVVAVADELRIVQHRNIQTQNDHGTGCTFASAVAAGLAHSADVFDAVFHATGIVHAALFWSSNWQLGSGRGPLNHLRIATPDPSSTHWRSS